MIQRRPRSTGVSARLNLCHRKRASLRRRRCEPSPIFILSTASLLFLFLNSSPFHEARSRVQFALATETAPSNKTQAPASGAPEAPPQANKLDCQPGEQRQFSYESSTKVWGSSNQQVRLTATLRLKCMEPPTNTTLKYLAEILSLRPKFLAEGQEELEQQAAAKRAKVSEQSQRMLRARQSMYMGAPSGGSELAHLHENGAEARAEPLFEEVGEAAIRMKRSVSGWFSRAWISVKDFFGNIFTTSERSSVSREQALRETGLDIAGQCKAPDNGKAKGIQGLPFDESVFEDLGPEYYVGASSLGGPASAFEFSGGRDSLFGPLDQLDDDDQPDLALSFFDDPKAGQASRTRRAASAQQSGTSRRSKSAGSGSGSGSDYNRLLKIPFVFLQSRSGKIIEVRLSSDESDPSVKNFKRHLCDLFATNLDVNKTTTNEVSPIGKHQTKYTLDSSANSLEALKEALMKSAEKNSSSEAAKQLVRVLATVGTSNQRESFVDANKKGAAGSQGDLQPELVVADDHDHDDDEQRDEPFEGSQRTAPGSGEISVLRSINTTSSVQLSSKMLAPEIERMEVRVKQVQQINEGRMIGTAGQLSMSLLQPSEGAAGALAARTKRQAPADLGSRAPLGDEQNIDDISQLLQVSTSFSMQLVPMEVSSAPGEPSESAAASARSLHRGRRASPAASGGPKHKPNGTAVGPLKRPRSAASKRATRMVAMAPKDSQELQRVLREWRKQEARLQLSATNLVAETSQPSDVEQQRLDVLRDQIRQRLNEEFVRNRIRRSLNAHSSRRPEVSADEERPAVPADRRAQGNDLGLGLTQLVLGNGITARRKGSIYSTIEEVVELEASLADEHNESAISRLMRDTVRMDKLRQHCRATIPSLEALCEAHKRPLAARLLVERTLPFGLKDVDENLAARSEQQKPMLHARRRRTGRRRMGAEPNEFEAKNERKFEQCRNVLQLMLKLNDRQAINLVVELIDESNQRLLAAAKSEELGYGPVGKYYRHLRRQLVQLIGHVARPTDSLIDKLLLRLHYPKLAAGSEPPKQAHKSTARRRDDSSEQPEFVYVASGDAQAKETATNYNRSLLKDEDDFNNNDAAGQLVMTLAALAAKRSVSRVKRAEVVEKLLQSLRGTSCSLFNAPDLDIIESMAQFQEPMEELAARLLSLARRCRQHDQYQVACVHGLAGQLGQASVQRFLADQLSSANASCTLKSEIVLALIGAQLVHDLTHQQARNESNEWPAVGINRLDETLLELLDSTDKQREPDRKCLRELVAEYLARKLTGASGAGASAPSGSRPARASKRRTRRAVLNENNFWDESQCKRWTIPTGPTSAGELPNELGSTLGARNGSLGAAQDLVDEIDDNSIISAMLSQQQWLREAKASRSFRGRSQKAPEREIEAAASSSSAGRSATRSSTGAMSSQLAASRSLPSTAVELQSFLRRRHKCTASKSFGPRNAQASLRAEIVNDLIGTKDENKFLARFRLSTNFLGNRIDVGRMYLWHQRQTTRAYANILGRSIWDTSQGCKDKPPHQMLYMPLFDFNLWLVKVSVGLRLSADMGFFSNCQAEDAWATHEADLASPTKGAANATGAPSSRLEARRAAGDQLQLFPTVSLRAAGEATAKLVVARAGMSVASHYGYQGSITVSRQPDSCMSIYSAHQPMNVTFSSWFQLWDNDCHFWGSRARAEPQAIKWRLMARKPMVWLEDECLAAEQANSTTNDHLAAAAAAAAAAAPAKPSTNGATSSFDIQSEPAEKSTRSTISP